MTRIASAGINLMMKKEKDLPVVVLNVWKERFDFVPRVGNMPNSTATDENSITHNTPMTSSISRTHKFNLHTFDLNTAEEKNQLPGENEPLNVTGNWLVQYENNTFMLAYDNKVKIIDGNGELKEGWGEFELGNFLEKFFAVENCCDV